MSNKFLLKTATLLMLIVSFAFAKTFAATIIVSGDITSNTTWTNNNIYVLTGIVYVTNNATLTINAGTRIQGDSATLGSLIITRGAKIMAVGTPCQPIVFTSAKAPGQRKRGDWGGLVLLGYSQVNQPGDTGHIEGIVPNPKTLYGGGANPNCGGGDCPNNSDNSGVLQYVRLEFAGIALSPNNEINSLTMGGVGNGTTIDHIQVSYANDDAYEWFGGNVNCKYLVSYSTLDDDFDSDNGYSGKVQFAFAMRDPSVADVSGSNSFETDNDASSSSNTPKTSAIFQNVTALGGASITTNPNFRRSAHFRRNTEAKVYNSVMMGFPTGILVDGCATMTNCAASSLVKNSYVHQASSTFLAFTPAGCADQANATTQLNGNGNVYSTTYSGVLTDPDYPLSNPDDLIPAAGNPLPSADNSLYSGGFWTSVSYVGAFDPNGDNWAGDWTNFDPVNTSYSAKIDYTPKVTKTVTKAICPNTGAVDLTVTDGFSPYSYLWSNGATTQDVTGLAKGTYSVTVFDAGGLCSKFVGNIKVNNEKPILTTCTNATSSTLTVNWSANLQGNVTGYQLRKKKHSVSSWDPWVSVGSGLSATVTGLLSNTQYDFQLRGTCASGNTVNSTILTCSTTLRLADENEAGQVMNVYPNPTEGKFTIELGGFVSGTQVTVEVTDVLGKVVYNNVNIVDGSLDVNLSDLTTGLYNVTVSDGANELAQKVMINK